MPWSNQGGGPWGSEVEVVAASGRALGPRTGSRRRLDPARPRRAAAPQPGQAEESASGRQSRRQGACS